ncbi:MAG: pantoate--beta-alanine ligase [Armatimonadetes bacterium]|nr:pantoate--beta-alanine ligase [Armatimonadota bacterium]
MQVIHAPAEMYNQTMLLKMSGKKVGFVPTMGYLHKGHLELLKFAREHCDSLVLSIFVNPTQFGPKEDYGSYPRDLERDKELAAHARVDTIFLPDVDSMYPPGYRTFVEVEELSKGLCGAFRPGHFRGVATIVCKLLNIVAPDEAFFGEKDAQQLVIIRKMAQDLNMPVKISGFPTVRDADGLAMSSRNVYLSDEEREQATGLYRALQNGRSLIEGGETEAARIDAAIREAIARDVPAGVVEYVDIVDGNTLAPVSRTIGKTLIALAVRVGKARLIDNIRVGG